MQFKNPYLGLPKAEILRTTTEIDKKRVALLRSYKPDSGVLQTTLSILLEKLSHELEQSNLTTGDWAAYEVAVAGAKITLGGGGTPEQPTAGPKSSKPRKASR